MRITLVCFPHAGGSNATYYCWNRFLPNHMQIVGPTGLDRNGKQESMSELWALIEDIACELRSVPGELVLYGHSMGALLAFDVARALSEVHGKDVTRIFVSGRRAPHVLPRTQHIHKLPDDEFAQALIGYGGMPPGIASNRRLLAELLPRIRSDLKLAENYAPIASGQLKLPISAIRATSDPLINAADMRAWSSHTSSDFAYHEVEGDHFIHCSNPAALLKLITRTVDTHPVEKADICTFIE